MRPEILAPAGDLECLRTAVRAGADAVYFGLQSLNARARAANFAVQDLGDVMRELHASGVKGYVTLNTLVFDHELPAVQEALLACAHAGVDAIIVQDLAVARLAAQIAPTLHVHASTQMTCTDAASVQFARSLGIIRVVLARELSAKDIARIYAETGAELEVFVHGALCVAYSGQCLTSEAIGGRSANRGACAQACRLPYELVVDGKTQDLGDKAYLLSPQDLHGVDQVPALAAAGVRSFKIEGRMKGPAYVAATVSLYRAAVKALALDAPGLTPSPAKADLAERVAQAFARNAGPGFLEGVNHQVLVDGRHCDHVGVPAGTVVKVHDEGRKQWVQFAPMCSVERGDGLLIEGVRENKGEVGGRVWDVQFVAPGKADIVVWLGPDVVFESDFTGRSIFRTSSPRVEKETLASLPRARRVSLAMHVRGALGEYLVVEALTHDGRRAIASSSMVLQAASSRGLDDALLTEKLGQLGDSHFELSSLHSELAPGAFVPPGELKQLRRALTASLDAQLLAEGARAHATDDVALASAKWSSTLVSAAFNQTAPQLAVLCRNVAQAQAAFEAGADRIYLDFLELTGTGVALRTLREKGAKSIGVCPPRVRKPGEQKIDNYLGGLAAEVELVRTLGRLHELQSTRSPTTRVGDFSLNVTNRMSATEVLARGCTRFTPSFDLNEDQLLALLDANTAPYAEVVLHHPMPLFYMEHCVYAKWLSDGADYTNCGRPCDTHRIALRDRAGFELPVIADVGCRNTVFHARPQSGAYFVPTLLTRGVRHFRIELVRESAAQVAELVQGYKALLAGAVQPTALVAQLRAEEGYGVVRGSLRVLQ